MQNGEKIIEYACFMVQSGGNDGVTVAQVTRVTGRIRQAAAGLCGCDALRMRRMGAGLTVWGWVWLGHGAMPGTLRGHAERAQSDATPGRTESSVKPSHCTIHIASV